MSCIVTVPSIVVTTAAAATPAPGPSPVTGDGFDDGSQGMPKLPHLEEV